MNNLPTSGKTGQKWGTQNLNLPTSGKTGQKWGTQNLNFPTSGKFGQKWVPRKFAPRSLPGERREFFRPDHRPAELVGRMLAPCLEG